MVLLPTQQYSTRCHGASGRFPFIGGLSYDCILSAPLALGDPRMFAVVQWLSSRPTERKRNTQARRLVASLEKVVSIPHVVRVVFCGCPPYEDHKRFSSMGKSCRGR
jgi:hypothetical protein